MSDDINIRIAGEDDISGVLEAIATQFDDLFDLAQRLNDAFSGVGAAMATSMDDVITASDASVEAMTSLMDSTASLTSVFDDSTRMVNQMAETFPKVTTAIADLNLMMDQANTVDSAFAAKVETIEPDLAQLGATLSGVTEIANLYSNAAIYAASSSTQMADDGNILLLFADSLDKQLGALVKQFQTYRDSVVNTGDASKDLIGSLDGVITDLKGMQAGLIAADEAASNLATGTPATADQIDRLRQIVKQLGQTAQDVGNLDFPVLRQGVEQAMDVADLAIRQFTDSIDMLIEDLDTTDSGVLAFKAALGGTTPQIEQATAALKNAGDGLMAMRILIMTQAIPAVQGLSATEGDLVVRMAAVNDAFAADAKISQDLAQKYVDMADKLVGMKQALNEAKSSIADAATIQSQFIDQLTANGATIEDYSSATLADFQALKAALKEVAASTVAVRTATDSMVQGYAALTEKLPSASFVMEEFRMKEEGARIAIDETSAALNTQAEKSLAASSGALDKFGNAWMGNLGLMTLGLDTFVAHAGSAGATFQQQMNLNFNLAANAVDRNLGGIGQGLQTMTNYLLTIGPTWGRTPTELAQALYYVMSDGFHGATALDILKTSAEATAGGLGNFAQQARAIAILMNNYNGSISEAGIVTGQWSLTASQAADIVINSVTAGSTTIEDYAKNLGKVAPIAAKAGYNAIQLSQAWDVFTRAGVSSAQTSTFLRSTMMQLGQRENEIGDKAQAMGINIDGATLEMIKQKGGSNALADQLQYMIQQIDIAAKSHGDLAHQAAFANEAFLNLTGGIRSGMGAALLSSNDFQNLASVQKQWAEQTNNGVSAAGHFQAMQQTLAFQMMVFKASLSAAYDQFVVTFGPQISAAIQKIANGLQHLTQWMQHLKPGQIHAVGAAILALVALVNGAFIASLTVGATHMLGMTRLLGLFGKDAHAAGSAAEAAHGGFGMLKNAAATLTKHFGSVGSMMQGPLLEGMVRTHVGGTGLLGVFGKLSDIGAQFGVTLSGKVGGALRIFGNAIIHPNKALDALAEKLGPLSDKLTSSVMGALEHGRNAVLNFTGVFGKLQDYFDAGGTPLTLLKSAFSGLWGVITGGIPAIMGMAGSFMAMLGPILLIVGAVVIAVIIFTHFRAQVGQIMQSLMGTLRPILTDIKNAFQNMLTVITTAWIVNKDKIMPAIQSLLNTIKNMGPTIQVVGTIIRIVAQVIFSVIGGLVAAFISVLPKIIGVFQGIFEVINGIAKLIVAIFTGHWSQIPGIIGGIFMGAVKIVENFIGMIVGFVLHGIQWILIAFNNLTGGVLGPIIGFVNGVIHWFQHLWDILVGHSIVPDMINGIIHWFLSLPGKILGMIGGFVGHVLGGFGNLAKGAITGIGHMAGGIIGHFLDINKKVTQVQTQLIHHVVGGAMNMAKGVIMHVAGMSKFVQDAHRIMADKAAIAADHMKQKVLIHTAQEHMLVAKEAMAQANALIAQAAHTKNAAEREALLKKAGVLKHFAEEHAMAARHAMQMAREVAAHAAKMAADAKAHAADMHNTFIGKVLDLVSNVTANFKNLPGKITGALGNLGSLLGGLMTNAIHSMVGAISNGAGIVGNAIHGLFSGAISGAKHLLGIASPSKVFAEIGGHTVEGFTSGMTVKGREVISTSMHVFGGAIGAAQNALTKLPAAQLTAPSTGNASHMALLQRQGGGASSGTTTIHLHLEGGLGAGLQLLNPTDRARFADQIARELTKKTMMQGTIPLGYSGRGTI